MPLRKSERYGTERKLLKIRWVHICALTGRLLRDPYYQKVPFPDISVQRDTGQEFQSVPKKVGCMYVQPTIFNSYRDRHHYDLQSVQCNNIREYPYLI